MWLVAVFELSLLPGLAMLIAPPLLRTRNRNRPLLAVLAVLWMLDAAFLVAVSRADVALADRTMLLSIDFVMILVTVIGGRIVPSFTNNALRRLGGEAQASSRPWLEKIVIALMVAVALVDLVWPHSGASGIVAALAAAAQAARLSGWRSFRTRGESILWVLHLGYSWLPIGLALKACWLIAGFSFAMKWQHAITMGVFSTMILAVMTRAALGHTGRALTVSPWITAAYVLLSAATLLRVFGPAAGATDYVSLLWLAAGCWAAAFLLYVIVYTPILTLPRADGKPG
jgi:uncharacterized protein involved in response to NO